MADFEKAVAVVLRHEGGYVNDPDDPGGETNYGISKRAYPHLDIARLTVEQAKAIYRADYWERIAGDSLTSQHYANALLDTAVNMGVRVALQAMADSETAFEIAVWRIRFYKGLALWKKYAAGWASRAVDFE